MNLSLLKQQLEQKHKELITRKQRLTAEDPFGDPERLANNAAVDADAAEQFGHENVSAMLEEIDRKLLDVDKALTRIEKGEYGKCMGCGKQIDSGRLQIDPVAEYCVECQEKKTVVDVG